MQPNAYIELNADFERRAVIHGAKLAWMPSPMAGVERRMLDRIGGEKARATSIVRYAPGSRFSAHIHGGGEEFLVLEGVFQDEHGDYPAGCYVRNPPQSRHTPGSESGCTILVKLWQFAPQDRTAVRLDTNHMAYRPDPDRPGVAVMALFSDAREDVRMERWQAGAAIGLGAPSDIESGDIESGSIESGGIEIFVLDGGFTEGGEDFARLSWLRLPPGTRLDAKAGPSGCTIWVKSGHLRHIAVPGADT